MSVCWCVDLLTCWWHCVDVLMCFMCWCFWCVYVLGALWKKRHSRSRGLVLGFFTCWPFEQKCNITYFDSLINGGVRFAANKQATAEHTLIENENSSVENGSTTAVNRRRHFPWNAESWSSYEGEKIDVWSTRKELVTPSLTTWVAVCYLEHTKWTTMKGDVVFVLAQKFVAKFSTLKQFETTAVNQSVSYSRITTTTAWKLWLVWLLTDSYDSVNSHRVSTATVSTPDTAVVDTSP
jgi:hypothetical protein